MKQKNTIVEGDLLDKLTDLAELGFGTISPDGSRISEHCYFVMVHHHHHQLNEILKALSSNRMFRPTIHQTG